jgi:hypothetical protein
VPKFDIGEPRASTDNVFSDAEFVERRQRIGRQGQAEPQLARAGGPFVDPDIPTSTAKRQAGGETANPGADDQSCAPITHATILLSFNSLLSRLRSWMAGRAEQ